MPDLISHGLVAYAARRPLRMARATGALMLGTALPDLASRLGLKALGEIYYFTGFFPGPQASWFWSPLHTPFTLALICWAIALVFEEKLRRGVLAALLAGVAIHLGLDLFQVHYGGGDPILFPFSWARFEIGVLGPETSVVLLPWLAAAVLVLEIGLRRAEERRGGRGTGADREEPGCPPGGPASPRQASTASEAGSS